MIGKELVEGLRDQTNNRRVGVGWDSWLVLGTVLGFTNRINGDIVPRILSSHSDLNMPNARHVLALLKTHIRGDDQEFMSVAMQVAAQEARQGHIKLAQQIRDLIDRAKLERNHSQQRLLILEPKGDLASLVTLQEPTVRLASLVLTTELETRLRRVLLEYRQQRRLRDHDLQLRRKLLFVGAPGTGKTTAAAAMAAELHIPLLVARLEGIITKFMGETAAKLRTIFDAMSIRAGVYRFDEFDALGTKRNQANDLGEIRRVLNSFLQFLEKDTSESLVIAATNHPHTIPHGVPVTAQHGKATGPRWRGWLYTEISDNDCWMSDLFFFNMGLSL